MAASIDRGDDLFHQTDGDFVKGNFWGLPSSFEFFNNYGRVFFASDMPQYLLNSVFITVPTVIGAVALSS